LPITFTVLLLAFRSVVVPLLAIAMNLLSVGAAYGLLTFVTQQGHGAHLFGFKQVSSVEAWIPLFLFSVLFGLSTDYHCSYSPESASASLPRARSKRRSSAESGQAPA
jgi:putative drug exporter of the RND superfamily